MTITTTTLKNAARAIGYDLWSDPDGSHYLVDYDGVKLKRWEPETSSADSFELMVLANLEVERCKDGSRVYVNEYGYAPYMLEANFEQDIFTATRRAILMAAADKGESLKCQ